MNYEIQYKSVKHGYARMQQDGSVKITIPRVLRNNKKFEAELIKQAQKMLEKHEKKPKIEVLTDQEMQLFGEKVNLDEIDYSQYKVPRHKTKHDVFFQETLLEYITPIVQEYAQTAGRKFQSIQIKKLRSRRGSCSHDQKLVFNQQLVHLPTRLIHYVAVHEVCHLKEKNHSNKFWDLVEKYCPDYKNLRKELRSLQIISA